MNLDRHPQAGVANRDVEYRIGALPRPPRHIDRTGTVKLSRLPASILLALMAKRGAWHAPIRFPYNQRRPWNLYALFEFTARREFPPCVLPCLH